MKNIILILIFTVLLLEAQPCTTDIYFGNGVWNTQTQGEEGRDELKKFMQKRASTPLTIEDEKNKLYTFKHAYNPTGGTKDDLIETFYQLKESGQITDGYFMGVYAALAAESNGEAFINKLRDIISKYNSDASEMFSLYRQSSFNQKHNVLLVAHSQGNLFGNKMYTLMSHAQKKKFRMVSVATPADHVAGYTNGGPYVTATGDYVIRPIPGSLPANIAGFGHTFIGTYLNVPGGGVVGDGSDNAPKIIALHVKSAYDNLLKDSRCGGYDQVFMHMYGLNTIKVYGSPQIEFTPNEPGDLLGEITLDKYDPPIEVIIPDTPEDRIIYVCSDPQIIYGDLNLYSGNYSNDYLTYKPGTIYSKQMLESREGLTYTITSRTGSKCADVSFSGELYDLALSAFD
ncbi:hypothetical protein [Sulfurovum sp.]|uniref:hypothetical protein n=1 Tax=Sulfurovum sp. TaxID=1969726 RepID=UPI0025E91D54|nr:hypothetical protein [Sulfurovum sp.]